MTELFHKKFLIPTTRLAGYDYGQPGYYFITICTKGRFCYFGEIVRDKMVLNNIGIQAATCWSAIPEHFPHVKLDEFIIMPNHVHGIIHIEENASSVETQNFASLQTNRASDLESYKNKFGPQIKNLSSIVRGFKIGVTKWTTTHRIPFAWQPRFYDHIIRTEKSYNGIQWYIQTNPERWDRDRNNPEGVFM